jgi:hypothetical protein
MRALLLLALVGCDAVTSIDDLSIPCTDDTTCPSNAWCDFMGSELAECRSLDTSQPPNIVYDGLTLGGQVVSTLTVPGKEFSDNGFRFHNEGSEAYMTVVIAAPACVHALSETRSDGELMDTGVVLDATFETDPDAGCAPAVTLAITATANKRVFNFTSQITIAP